MNIPFDGFTTRDTGLSRKERVARDKKIAPAKKASETFKKLKAKRKKK